MSFQIPIPDPQTITVISEAIVLVAILLKYGYDWYRCAMGSVYRVRICAKMANGRFKQIETKLVPINKGVFNMKEHSYVIEPEKVLFNDPAPTLIFSVEDGTAQDFNSLATGIKAVVMSSRRIHKLIKEQVVAGMIKSTLRPLISYESLIMGAAIGLAVGIVLSRYLKF